MPDVIKKTIEQILRVYARHLLKRKKPLVVGVTGSVGKTSTKEAIAVVLVSKYKTWQSQKNYNNELGVPLTILGLETGGRSIAHWIGNLIQGLFIALFVSKYPQALVLEMGIDRPGDMDYLLTIVRPQIAVLTAIGPTHLEYFDSVKHITEEKGKLAQTIRKGGTAILNSDDERVRKLGEDLRCRVLTFGFHEKADVRGTVSETGLVVDSDKWLQAPDAGRVGISFKVEYNGQSVPVRLPGVGLPTAYAALAAAGVGLSQKMNLVKISSALRQFQPLPGRMRLIEGVKRTMIIDDTYNSAPASALAALNFLNEVHCSGAKVAVLGDMLELGIYTEEGHRQVGHQAAKVVDYLVTVGRRAKFIAQAAREAGLSRVREFDTYTGVGEYLENQLNEFDVTLVKASQGIRLEKVVKEIMAHPEKASKLLVRQSKRWEQI
ncbi:UDP-N-acetylmuramoyl-tripeptide--D-alanyl-D-alanine ligase [Patescibacteria group bacterium]